MEEDHEDDENEGDAGQEGAMDDEDGEEGAEVAGQADEAVTDEEEQGPAVPAGRGREHGKRKVQGTSDVPHGHEAADERPSTRRRGGGGAASSSDGAASSSRAAGSSTVATSILENDDDGGAAAGSDAAAGSSGDGTAISKTYPDDESNYDVSEARGLQNAAQVANPAPVLAGKRSRRGSTASGTEAAKRRETERLQATVTRKRKAAVWVRYVDGGAKAGGTLARRIAISTVTVDRIVGDKYEWRDDSYRRKRARRGEEQTTVFDDGG